MKCTSCGKEISDSSTFCGFCGAKLSPPGAEPTIQVYNNGGSPAQAPVKPSKNIGLFILCGVAAMAIIAALVYKFVLPAIYQNGSKTEVAQDTAVEPGPEPDMANVRTIISNYANNAEVAVCVVDLKRGSTFSTENAKAPMSASALTILPLLYCADAETVNGNKSLSDIDIVFRHTSSGRGIMTKSQNGGIFNMDHMIRTALAYSDNNAMNSLIDHFGMSEIVRICAEKGYASVDFQKYVGHNPAGKDNFISAEDAAHMLAEMYNSGSNINSGYLINNFRITDRFKDDGMGKYMPATALFLNHNAFTDKTYNEICIVADAAEPYVLAFISNNGNYKISAEAAARVSEYIYSVFNR